MDANQAFGMLFDGFYIINHYKHFLKDLPFSPSLFNLSTRQLTDSFESTQGGLNLNRS